MASTATKPIYALVGSDPFLQLQRLGEILRQLPDDIQRVDADGEKADLADVLDELRSFAMFGGGKVVVVRNGDEFITRFRESLEEYANHPSDSAVLVLRLSSLPKTQRIYKAIAKTGSVEDCSPPKDLKRWVAQHAQSAHKVKITPDAAELLVDLIGDDLGRLDTELAKLSLAAEHGTITAEVVGNGVAFQRERQMWDMTNELAAGRPEQAMRKWRQLITSDTSAEFRAVTWLGIWLENVRKALAMKRRGANEFTICQQLRIWPRELQQPFIKTAETLGDFGVARALDLLAKIDLQSKSGVGDAATNVERFILTLAAEQ